ncbi:glycosyltransferase involved in cell wall biosynthesis [Geomicrobium halophilum]|uniref:Glycosyltransferase involved in cell wall biosynthesis n=1 Tax=Geomicrobium halophilum TaxID=549000 RepID=A0A841PMC7_9BACL|nr:glycosyltransferase involved in cell wall biosynthesis [Geomicrobium halophilum]
MVIAESLAVGTPIISTNCNRAPREILDDAQYEILVNVGDPEQLANAILNECIQIGDNSNNRHNDFDISKITKVYFQELD